mmetsp:Transcript_8857/g.27832  ORF Transcript_8857/g.27832 Transcript_8857/m.27832 type:complete len:301 (-) Transcript_8857:395-1297(-)
MESDASTAPPPGTTELDSSTRLTTHSASCSERSSSCSMCSLAPRNSTEHALACLAPWITRKSSSATRSSVTLSAMPRHAGSKDSSPSMFAKVVSSVPPVSFAIRRKSSRLTRLHAIAPASTKYLSAISSMPFVVRITFAPAARRSLMRSAVMSSSFARILASSDGSETSTCTPMCILDLRRSMSRRAIFAPLTCDGMPCAARPIITTYPLRRRESFAEPPCCVMMPTDLTGYFGLPSSPITLTVCIASTAIFAKKSESLPKILELSVVFAHCKMVSVPSDAVLCASVSLMYFTPSRMARR